MASGCIHEEALFVSLDDLDNISILLGKDNDLEKEITRLFNEVFLALTILKTCAIIWGNFERFQVCFLL